MRTARFPCRQRWPFFVFLALFGAGCATPTAPEPAEEPRAAKVQPGAAKERAAPPAAAQPAKVPVPGRGERELERGINSYEEGEYKTAARQLQAALDLGLEARSAQARAHKYLAFITCTTGREKPCRDEFGKALDADPQFDLEPAEAGHPIWSAVLRSVRAERSVKAKPK
jgi:Tfp pilus assembly protein PilF